MSGAACGSEWKCPACGMVFETAGVCTADLVCENYVRALLPYAEAAIRAGPVSPADVDTWAARLAADLTEHTD